MRGGAGAGATASVQGMPTRVPLVLLHPFPLDAGFWDPVAAALAPERTVLAPELPGFGRAPAADEVGIDAFADDVAELVAALPDGGRAAVAGVSMGGYVALSLAARHPERVAALVLVDTRAEPDGPEAATLRRTRAGRIRAKGARSVIDELVAPLVAPGNDEAMARARAIAGSQNGPALARALEALATRADRVPDLPRIAVPALVVAGDQDAVIPLASATALAEGLPDAELRLVAGAGHLPPLERPAEFLALLRDFLARRVDP